MTWTRFAYKWNRRCAISTHWMPPHRRPRLANRQLASLTYRKIRSRLLRRPFKERQRAPPIAGLFFFVHFRAGIKAFWGTRRLPANSAHQNRVVIGPSDPETRARAHAAPQCRTIDRTQRINARVHSDVQQTFLEFARVLMSHRGQWRGTFALALSADRRSWCRWKTPLRSARDARGTHPESAGPGPARRRTSFFGEKKTPHKAGFFACLALRAFGAA